MLKNVIVFRSAPQHAPWAIELGWVREVFTLGFLTPVPGAPRAVVGLVSLRGAMISVLDIHRLTQEKELCAQGPSALLLEVDRMHVALQISTVEEVTTIEQSQTKEVRNAQGELIRLVDPSLLLKDIHNQPSRLSHG